MQRKQGFTLVELVIVIAILGLIAVVGLRQYGTVRQKQAQKMDAAQMRHIAHAIEAYDLVNENDANRFDNFDSLVDCTPGGSWTGTAGTYSWDGATNAYPGIYAGSWKVLKATYDATGHGGSTPDLDAALAQNAGLASGLGKELGLYFLTAADVEAMNGGGVVKYLLHNPSTAQATGSGRGGFYTGSDTVSEDGYEFVNGGPGFRVDNSAFYPVKLKEGSPVAVLNPKAAYAVFTDLGYGIGATNSATMSADELAEKAGVKLVCFGIGKASNLVTAPTGLGKAPTSGTLERRFYRYYVAVFALKSAVRGTPASFKFAGVLNPSGSDEKTAQFNADWN